MRTYRLFPWFGLLTLILSACAVAASSSVPPTPTPVVPTDTPVPSAPAPVPTPESDVLLPAEDPPPGAERQFSTDFGKHSVPYSEILSGGPPKDGIPAIDEPRFVSVDEADAWLRPQEAVFLVEAEGDARAYPIQILMWHEIVNDIIANDPILITY